MTGRSSGPGGRLSGSSFHAPRVGARSHHAGRQVAGDFVDLREPLRHASYHAEARADLPEWLGHANTLLAAATSTDVAVRAQYAIVTATAYGLDTLRRADGLLRDFFTTVISEVTDPGSCKTPSYSWSSVSARSCAASPR